MIATLCGNKFTKKLYTDRLRIIKKNKENLLGGELR